jgi:hypothetical protein
VAIEAVMVAAPAPVDAPKLTPFEFEKVMPVKLALDAPADTDGPR